MEWSPQQDAALIAVSKWIKDKSAPQVFRLFGWAGTGKSTLAVHLAQDVKTVKYAAFTGKAALVMRKRGCKGAQTIHSLIYSLVSEKEGEPRFVLDPESSAADADLIVIDEVSMVDEQLGRDLLSFGTKVLVLGDPFQLPPVQGAGFFTAEEPDIMLTAIHRQASDNPIIRLSMDLREGGYPERGRYDVALVGGRAAVRGVSWPAASRSPLGGRGDGTGRRFSWCPEGRDKALRSQSAVPAGTNSATAADRPVMVPALWALSGCSIFMASRTTMRSPAST